jgi:hypothetical protein
LATFSHWQHSTRPPQGGKNKIKNTLEFHDFSFPLALVKADARDFGFPGMILAL